MRGLWIRFELKFGALDSTRLHSNRGTKSLQIMFSKWLNPAGETGPLDLVLRLTALEILLRPMGFWAIRAPLLVIAAVALLVPRVLRAPLTWCALSLLIAWQLIDNWPLPDNHIYLLCYWCFAIFLALRSLEMNQVLATSSRFLLGLTFLFAFLWKGILSPDYLDGRFFRVTLLQDERFAHTSMVFGDLQKEQLEENREYLFALPHGAELLHPPRLVEPPALRKLAHFFTWGALFSEGALALLLLLPLRGSLKQIRHILLLLFCILTYAFAPVSGFGWLVLVMGLVQCDPSQGRLRAAYVITFLLVLLYSEVPWTRILYDFKLE